MVAVFILFPMPKTRQQKEQTLSELTADFERSTSAVVVGFSGLPVAEATKLRRACRAVDAEYVVAKKTLLRRALAARKLDIDLGTNQNVGLVLGYGDVVATAKAAAGFAKEHKEQFTIVSGVLDGAPIAGTLVTELSLLPSREELLAKAVGSLAAPLSGLVGVLSGTMRSFVYALRAVGEQKNA